MNPALVIVHVSGFGRNGPFSSRPGYDPVAQGFSGLSYNTGDPEGPPMRAGGSVPVCDFTSGYLGALGAILALYERKTSGKGQVVDIALYDSAFRFLAPLITYFDNTGKILERAGNRSLGGAPTGHFETSDGRWVCVSVQNDDQFERCAQLVGHEEWIGDPRLRTLAMRTDHRVEIDDAVAGWIATKTREEVMRLFAESRLVCGEIYSPEDAAHDEHLQVRSLTTMEEPGIGPTRVPRVVPMLSRSPGEIRGPAPELGRDTAAVLKALGYDSERIRRLAEMSVIPVEGN
jgi:formyl-CoA transferase